MADNVEILDSAEVGVTVATHELAGNVHASKTVNINEGGSITVRPSLDISRGLYSSLETVNKFGRSTDVDSGVDTHIWDRANSTDTQPVWLAPTAARIHTIVSSSTDDDGSPVGTGARTIEIEGLTGWSSTAVAETVTMDGTSGVATANSYVIIHRMTVKTWGSAGPNVGKITATAATDSTVTAQINADEGQTQMAVYGVPSTHTAYVTKYYMSAIKAASSLAVEGCMHINTQPDSFTSGCLIKHTIGLATEGTSYMDHEWDPHFKVVGPAIIMLAANSSATNTDVSGGFDLILEEN